MRMIITGGTGLIGSALVEDWSCEGNEVILLTRRPSEGRLPDAVRAVQWDGRSSQGWGSLADGATVSDGYVVIVNLAGESIGGRSWFDIRWTPDRKRRILQSRLNAGEAVSEAIQSATIKPRVLIQASAVGYYGSRSDPCVTEAFKPGTDFLASVCQQWEASTAMVEDSGVRRVVIRLGVVISTKGGALQRQMLPFRLFAGGPIGSGMQGYSWIHPADVVGAIRLLIEKPQASGVFNLSVPNPVRNAEFGRVLAKVMRRPFWLPAPAFVFRLALGESAAILLGGQFAVPERLLSQGYSFRYPHLEPALRDLLA